MGQIIMGERLNFSKDYGGYHIYGIEYISIGPLFYVKASFMCLNILLMRIWIFFIDEIPIYDIIMGVNNNT